MSPVVTTSHQRFFFSTLFVVLVLGALQGLLCPAHAQAQQQQEVSAAVEQAAQRAFHGSDLEGKDGPLSKLDPTLIQLYHRARKTGRAAGGAQTHAAVRGGAVVIDALAAEDASALLRDLEDLGLQQGAVAGPLVSGRLPVERLEEAAQLASLRSARATVARVSVGQATSQGVKAMNADDARDVHGVDGSGVTVGVLSDSYDRDENADTDATEDMNNGDLPGQVNVLDDNYADGSDEGRAMMQLIYDTAPGTDFAFHSAFNVGRAGFAQGIRELANNAGATVIVDDVINLAEPMFQDGQVAQAVDDVVQNDGVAYFSSAGNASDQSYESEFRDSGQNGPLDGGTLHDFDSSGGTYTRQRVSLAQGNTLQLSFQWDQPFASTGPGSESDLDIFIADKNGDTLAAATVDNNGNDRRSGDESDPVEVLTFVNDGSVDADNDGTADTRFQLGIELQSGPQPGLMKYVRFGSATVEEYGTNSATLFGHANADSAEAIGAAYYDDTPEFGTSPPVLEGFSAEGGTPILFNPDGTRKSSREVRQKPELVAPDGTNNTFFGSDFDGDGSPNFFGTSAAAPHAAGVAALFREARPSSAPETIYAELERTATDMKNPYSSNRTATENSTDCSGQFDFGTGCGLVNAEQAALPVTLAGGGLRGALDERDDASAVVLTWTTLSETGNDRFRILQKHDEGFAQVGTEPTQAEGGASSRPLDYRHRVGGLAPGTHVFRLVQVDADGAERRIGETRVEVGFEGSYQLTAAHPNPFRTHAEARLTVRRSQHVTAALYDASGRRVRTLHDGPLPGGASERFAVTAEALSSGVYVLRVSGETFSATRTLTLVR